MKNYEEIAKKFVAQIEKGGLEWKKPWATKHVHHNAVTGHIFTGWNPFWCELSSLNQFTSCAWATYKQWKDVGVTVQEHGHGVSLLRPRMGKDKETGKVIRFGWAEYFVFNKEQTNFVDEKIAPEPEIFYSDAEEIVTMSGALIQEGTRACYIPSKDVILLPPRRDFVSEPHFHATRFHELGHWTKHESRLERQEDSYAKEELVAELCSAFLCAETNVACTDTDEQHAAYLSSWAKFGGAEVFAAVSKAQSACQYILSMPAQKRKSA